MADIAEISARILAAEKELSDAVAKTLIVVGSPAWIAAKADLTELRREKNNLTEKQGECLASRCPSASSLATHAWSETCDTCVGELSRTLLI